MLKMFSAQGCNQGDLPPAKQSLPIHSWQMENPSYLSNAPQLWMLDILHRVAVIHFLAVSGGEENEGSTHTFHYIAAERAAKGARSLINSSFYRPSGHIEQTNQDVWYSAASQ